MKPVFIGGCERSGTTMLGAMLGCHSRSLCLPESQFMDDQLAHADSDGRIDSRAALGRIVAHERFRLLWGLSLEPASVQADKLGSTLADLWTWLAQAYGRKAGNPRLACGSITPQPTSGGCAVYFVCSRQLASFISFATDGP